MMDFCDRMRSAAFASGHNIIASAMLLHGDDATHRLRSTAQAAILSPLEKVATSPQDVTTGP